MKSQMSPDRIYHQIGVAIRVKRKSLSLTQHMLAARLGISRAALANIETGRQKVFVHYLYSLAEALEMKPHELLPLLSEHEPADSAQLPLPEGLKPEQRNQIVHLVTGVELDAPRKREES
jgi:transcriptional regulator with XRE-family HTH domain